MVEHGTDVELPVNRHAATWPITNKDDERLYRVTYTSRIRDPTFSVRDIVRQSKENNQRLGVGGVLQYNQSTGEITQVLEGHESIVKGLLDKINGDWRHCCLEIKQEEWPKKRVWHKWGGMLLSHSGHWKVVKSPSCTRNPNLLASPPSLRLRPKKATKRKTVGRRLHSLPFPDQVPLEEAKEESIPEEERVTTPYGDGHLISLERDGILKIQLKFGIAYIHQSKLALPPKARIGPEGMWEEEKTSPKWTVALIDRSRYLDGEQHLMYVFTRVCNNGSQNPTYSYQW